jgi:Cell division control protein, negative regulator of transcription
MFSPITEPEQLGPLLEDIFQAKLSRWNLLESSQWGYIAYGIQFDLPDDRHCRQWIKEASERTGADSWENIDHSAYWNYRNDGANFNIMIIACAKKSTLGFATVISLHMDYSRRVPGAMGNPDQGEGI